MWPRDVEWSPLLADLRHDSVPQPRRPRWRLSHSEGKKRLNCWWLYMQPTWYYYALKRKKSFRPAWANVHTRVTPHCSTRRLANRTMRSKRRWKTSARGTSSTGTWRITVSKSWSKMEYALHGRVFLRCDDLLSKVFCSFRYLKSDPILGYCLPLTMHTEDKTEKVRISLFKNSSSLIFQLYRTQSSWEPTLGSTGLWKPQQCLCPRFASISHFVYHCKVIIWNQNPYLFLMK